MSSDGLRRKEAWPIGLTDIVSAAVEAHQRMASLFAEPAATQAAAEVIRPLVEGYVKERP